MGSITDATILHHVCIVFASLWFLNYLNYCSPVAYFLAFIYLYLVHDGYVVKLRKKLQFEESRDANQRRVLVDSESVRWLNLAIEKIWSICMEEIVSQKILLPIVPWFLKKYKPWTAKDIDVQHLYLGRSPPIFTEMRVRHNVAGDDHLVLELGMNFRTADDMSAILGVKLRRRLGFGMLAKLHLLGMHIEGKVLVGIKFLRGWPFIGRLRVCFAGPPYFQMTVKPIFTHGLDVTELPGIAGWIDNLLALVFEQTLVEPNMLVVDVEKFVSPQPGESWFSVDAKEPIAHAVVEVLEAADMKPSDMNGLADPYVKGKLGPYRFRSKTKKKTLAPKWREEFKIPICTWDTLNMLMIEVHDKDHIFDDKLGDCCVNVNELRDGQRHDMWLPLQNIKTGRLHLAVTVLEENGEKQGALSTTEVNGDHKEIPFEADSSQKDYKGDLSQGGSFSSRTSEKSPKVADKFEPINIEGQTETGIWIHHPGSEVVQVWQPRKGKNRHLDSHKLVGQVQVDVADSQGSFKSKGAGSGPIDGSSTDESTESTKSNSKNSFRRGLSKIGSMFHRSPRDKDKPTSPREEELEPSPRDNILASDDKEVGVKLILDSDLISPSSKPSKDCKKDPDAPHNEDTKPPGNSAGGLRSTFSRKVSRSVSKAEPRSLATHNDGVSESSDDDETLPSPTYGLLIPGSPVSAFVPGSGNNSSKSLDNNQTSPLE
ncbi:C2 domain-containing protein At1g53590-like [Andrographis paniculata]|uniref:C2 domain-containing protein At1g53590-like n=1 Tax=Andrographis paniculata TaxID=175694 RepID=UPI0021E975F2|nr:C2 domain-containing protein At1g53590-like [Andrographis paniculata]XP_051151863.1 C2 domain-containing protein At1g53590-like [Andrographis paniculata]